MRVAATQRLSASPRRVKVRTAMPRLLLVHYAPFRSIPASAAAPRRGALEHGRTGLGHPRRTPRRSSQRQPCWQAADVIPIGLAAPLAIAGRAPLLVQHGAHASVVTLIFPLLF